MKINKFDNVIIHTAGNIETDFIVMLQQVLSATTVKHGIPSLSTRLVHFPVRFSLSSFIHGLP